MKQRPQTRWHSWSGPTLVLLLTVAARGLSQAGPFFPADRLVAMQEADGSWVDWPGMEVYTGYIVPGLVRCYELSGYTPYKTSAELGGTWVLNNKPPLGVSSHYLLGEEAYAMERLSDIAPDPSSNAWRTEIANFYADLITLYPGGTSGYANDFRFNNDPSIAAVSIAHHVSAAYYVMAFERAIWRTELIDTLAGVTDDTAYYPVMALGASLWALTLTGELDNTLIDPAAPPGSTWDGARLVDLPGMLLGHQEPTSGGFYWRFDHDTAPGYPAYGYTEDTIFGTLGLMASASYGSYDVEILKGLYAVNSGYEADGSMQEHLWEGTFATHVYAGEALRLAIPEPTSAALLGGCLAALAGWRRRRREMRRAAPERL